MKALIGFILLSPFLISHTGYGQPKPLDELQVLDKSWQPTNVRSEAKYLISIRKFRDTVWQRDVYHFVGPLIRSETFSDHDGKVLNGPAWYYNENGELDSTAEFKNGKKDGEAYHIEREGDSLVWKKLYVYRADLLMNEGGTEMSKDDPRVPGFLRAQYPGGEKKWINYCFRSFEYTVRAVQEYIHGELWALFAVDEKGKLGGFAIGRSLEYSMDREMLRVIRLSRDWIPATIDGLPVKCHMLHRVYLNRPG